MGRVIIARSADVTVTAFPDLQGVSTEGRVKSRCVIGGPDRPLFLRKHELAAGAKMRFASPPVGHTLYIWDGDVEVDGTQVACNGAAIVEHKASARLRAGQSGAVLAHFHPREDLPDPPKRAGGNVHLVDPSGIFQDHNPRMFRSAILFADSACPTCELYLQRSDVPAPPPEVAKQRSPLRHFHTVRREYMLVREGAMMVGKRSHRGRTARSRSTHTRSTRSAYAPRSSPP